MTKEEIIEECIQRLGFETDYEMYSLCQHEKDFLKAIIKALNQPTSDDVMAIHTQGLDEGIRCAMCTNSMKSDRGCDGGCVVNEAMYKEVMNTIRNHIVPPVTPKPRWIPVSERLPEVHESGDSVNRYMQSNPVLVYGTCEYEHNAQFHVVTYCDDLDGNTYWSTELDAANVSGVIAWMPLPEPYKAESEDKE